MTTVPRALRRTLPPRWITVLVAGVALYGAVYAVLFGTRNILYVPSLLLIGAAVVPVTFITFVGALPRRGELPFTQIAVAAAVGGVIGTVVAGSLDGLVLGVAVGSGFALLETMGYAFVALVRSGGQLAATTQLLLVRSVTEPGGHAAWTGLACAALFAIRTSRRTLIGWLRFVSVFAGVVALHTTWYLHRRPDPSQTALG